MSKEELLAALKICKQNEGDVEMAHYDADLALLEYINDPEIKSAFEDIKRWYA